MKSDLTIYQQEWMEYAKLLCKIIRLDGVGGSYSIHSRAAPTPSILAAWSSTHSIQMDGVGASSFSSYSAPSISMDTAIHFIKFHALK